MLVSHACPPPPEPPPVLAQGAQRIATSPTGEVRMTWDAPLDTPGMTCPGCRTSFVFTAAGWLPLKETE